MSKSFTLIEVILILIILSIMVDICYSVVKIDYDINLKIKTRGENY